MRFLNKVIFLNSANIQNAEIMLNGNVHFSGTQGVGKSTILRAILFFYNADKMHLGISSSQKSFEEFYFPYANSYIIYEVATERGNYSILASRNQGQINFRFIDAPFDYNWLVDQNREVETNWPKIHSNIGSNIFVSNKINTYEQYRDIIFGNRQGKIRNLERFSIVESSKYQNIPRSIQNVFLNSKLDAEFIKNTLINSIDEADMVINLDNYRSWLSKFEREFSEIDCWFKKDKSGMIPVRKVASEMIISLRDISACEYDIIQFWHQLNYAVEKANERIPRLEYEIEKLTQEIRDLVNKDKKAQEDFDERHAVLLKKLGGIENFLKACFEKRRYYESIHIRELLENEDRRPQIEKRIEALYSQLQLQKTTFQQTDLKFKLLKDSIETERSQFILSQESKLQNFINGKNETIEIEREKAEKEKKALDNDFELWMQEHNSRWELLYQDFTQAEYHLKDLKNWKPLKEEIDLCQENIKSLQQESKHNDYRIENIESQINVLRTETEYKVKEVEREFDNQIAELSRFAESLKNELKEVEDKVGRYDGSLYQWLCANKKDWKENIGKVVNEDILFNSDLHPSISKNQSETLYGVTLDLENIEVLIKTADEMKLRKKEIEESIKTTIRNHNNILEEKQKSITNINKSFNTELSEINKEKSRVTYRLSILPDEIKNTETKLRLLLEEEKEKIKEEKEEREKRKNETWSLVKKEDERAAIKQSDLKKKKNKLDSDIKILKKKLEKEETALRVDLERETLFKEEIFDSRLKKVEEDERKELKSQGADVEEIKSLEKKISETKADLKKIEDSHDIVVKYKSDKKDFLDIELSKKHEKELLETKEATLKDTFGKSREKREKTIKEKKKELESSTDIIKKLKNGLHCVKIYTEKEKDVPFNIRVDATKKKTNLSCEELVAMLRGKFADKSKFFNDLKRHTHNFTSFFSPDNIFSFKFPVIDEDFVPFAYEVKDFVENDKIKEYESRVSQMYKSVLASLTRETSQLLNSSSQISHIILALNEDFRRKNFAGVIKKIELRSTDSSDSIMQLLVFIQNFSVENQMNLGEANLFSDADHQKITEDVTYFLKKLLKELQKHPEKKTLSLTDTFRLQFRIQENDNDSGFKEHLSHIGSDGTDILVKAIVNILLINVFKEKASKKNKEFIIHCMMDEIGKLHPSNVAGILQFANARNIYLINSSPMSYNADSYKHNYLLTKNSRSQTIVQRTITILDL